MGYGAAFHPSMPLVPEAYYQAPGHEQLFAYGATPHLLKLKTQAREERSKILVSMALGFFLPWILFTCMFLVNSFSTKYNSPLMADMATVLCYIVALLCGYFAYVSFRKWRQGVGTPEWPIFLFITCLLACCVGQAVAQVNYVKNMRPYYDIDSMQNYPAMDPARNKGQQLMDLGQVTFVKGSRLELSKSIGFRNKDVYCVAPIVSGNGTMDTYDFWAVGVNCCSGHLPDFRCGEYNNPYARSGLRLMQDKDRSYFRLAVDQAVAAHNIKVTHPVFLHFMQNPMAEVNAYQDEGYKCFVFGVCLYLVLQILLVSSAAYLFYKVRARKAVGVSTLPQAVVVM